jgi:hypothetical protein
MAFILCALAALVYDVRSWKHRRPDALSWQLFVAPWRWLNADLYTDQGNRYRRLAIRYAAVAIGLALAALATRPS